MWQAILGAGLSLAENRQKGQINSLLAKDQRSWSEQMSSNAYRRGMKDMKLAGLNPILAYQKGPASTPSGAAATIGGGGGAAAGLSAGSAMAIAQEQAKNLKETNTNIRADTRKKEWEAKLNENLAYNAKQQHHVLEQTWRGMQSDNFKKKAEEQFYKTEFGQFIKNLGITMDALSPFLQSNARSTSKTPNMKSQISKATGAKPAAKAK